jgi:hypothetical protein
LITDLLLKEFSQHALYGEEGIVGDQTAEYNGSSIRSRTVNYFTASRTSASDRAAAGVVGVITIRCA